RGILLTSSSAIGLKLFLEFLISLETGAVFTFGKSKFADNLPNKFWVKNDRVLQVACGDEHTALVAESGRVFMFGPNDWGQLGLGQENKGVNRPSCVKLLKHEKSKYVACGRSHTLVSTESGHIYTFGSHSDGQLGYETSTSQHTPRRIESLEPTKYKILAAGSDSSAALTADGRAYVWGGNEDGKLGLGDLDTVVEPALLPVDRPVTCIACGYYHTAFVTDDGKLFTMGEPDGGKLGLPDDVDDTNVPQEVTSIKEPIKWVACGSSHTVALSESGKCYVFGEGESGQLGLGTDVLSTSTPTLLNLPFKVARVHCGQAFTALISEKGQLYTFGDGRHGKLAHGNDQFSNQYKPFHCKRFSSFIVTKVACGGCHMIVTAKPKQGTADADNDESVDEMKLFEDSSLSETIGRGVGSPSLTRSLSAREKRRNEVTRSFSTLYQTLPALASTNGLRALSATMPPIKSSHAKTKGDALSKTTLPKLGLLNGASSEHDSDNDGEEEVPDSVKEKKGTTGRQDGSEGDDENEASSEDEEKIRNKDSSHNKPEEEEDQDLNESDDEVLALSAELQNQMEDDDSSDGENEKLADRSKPHSLSKQHQPDLNDNKSIVKDDDETQDMVEIINTAKDKNEWTPSKKGPLPVPRKKKEGEEKEQKKKEDDNEEEEDDDDEDDEDDEDEDDEEEDNKTKDKKKDKTDDKKLDGKKNKEKEEGKKEEKQKGKKKGGF
ncbi:unnamed protein product, partial [Lymnaea stagnalis]